jgi:hypothetical protein
MKKNLKSMMVRDSASLIYSNIKELVDRK